MFYDLPPVRSRRAAGIGYGNKYDFTKGQEKAPAPNAYEPKGTLDDMRKKSFFSFSFSEYICLRVNRNYAVNKLERVKRLVKPERDMKLKSTHQTVIDQYNVPN